MCYTVKVFFRNSSSEIEETNRTFDDIIFYIL